MRYFYVNRYESEARRRKRKLKPYIYTVVFFGILTLVIGKLISPFMFNKQFETKVEAQESSSPPPDVQGVITQKEEFKKQSDKLGKAVQKALEGTTGRYGVYITHLQTGESYFYNEHEEFNTASLYKLWVMATVYDQIYKGELTEEEVLTKSVPALNNKFNISEDYAELTSGTITYPIKRALYEMITISDNYSALLLTDKIELANIKNYLEKNGFKESKVSTKETLPKSTPADMGLFMEKLYKGQLADETYTKKMLELLKAQKLNNELPKYLPLKVQTAHKTGELPPVTHDAGIVYTDVGDYIIVIMSESNNTVLAKERIALVSKATYEYFSIEN